LKEAKKAEPPDLTVKKYANTRFVNVMVEKPFYIKLEKAAEELGTTAEVVINNALLLIVRGWKKGWEAKNERRQNSA